MAFTVSVFVSSAFLARSVFAIFKLLDMRKFMSFIFLQLRSIEQNLAIQLNQQYICSAIFRAFLKKNTLKSVIYYFAIYSIKISSFYCLRRDLEFINFAFLGGAAIKSS